MTYSMMMLVWWYIGVCCGVSLTLIVTSITLKRIYLEYLKR